MRKFLLLLLVILHSLFTGAQFYEYGQDPASIKWKSISSVHFKVIFPAGFEKEASRMLILLDSHYDENSAQLDHYPGKIPVVLHTSSAISNGFVVWAPRRVEMFMYPDVKGYSQDWSDQLALHEFRHVVQVDKLNQGITKVLTILLGQQGIGPAVGMVPFWFLEGDAVYAETSLSQSGRGRLPSFEMGIKAQLLTDKRPYTFSKSYLGSYRDFVPNYYQYGYQMITYGRYNYGNDIWTGALNYVGRNPYLFDPLFFYLHHKTGKGKAGLYRNTMSFLESHWDSTASNRSIHLPASFNERRTRTYTSWNEPHLLPDLSVIAVKSGLDNIQTFVRLDSTGGEKKLFTPGRLNSGNISVSHNHIVWDESVPGLRWDNRSYSVIRQYDYETGKVSTLSRRSRFSAPSFSTTGDTIVAVETTMENDFRLVFISSLDGSIFTRIPSPRNIQLQDPAWISHTGSVVAIGVDRNGKTLLEYNLERGTWKNLLPASFVNISDPVSAGQLYLFQRDIHGCG